MKYYKNSKLIMTKKVCNLEYCISSFFDENNQKWYYVHKNGFSYMPVYGSVKTSLKQSKVKLCQILSVTMSELKTL